MKFYKRKNTEHTKYVPTVEHRKKISLKITGRMLSTETKNKISLTLRGNKSRYWKKIKVGYAGIHARMQKMYGRPNSCDFCKSTRKRNYDWANISGNYFWNRSDWYRLCRSCHVGWDRSKNLGQEEHWLIKHNISINKLSIN